MITYEYECEECKHNFDTQQSIKEKPLVKCPNCLKDSLQRVIHVGIAFVKEGITDKTTLGKLAEVNTAKMGTYEKQEKREEQRQAKIAAKEALQQEKAAKAGANPIDVRKQPFYKKINPNPAGPTKINKMTAAEKERYVKEGTT